MNARMMMDRLVVLLLVVLVADSAPAITIHVPADQPTIADAIAVAQTGDIIVVDDYVFLDEPIIDWCGKAVRVESTSDLDQPYTGVYRLGAGAIVAAASGGTLNIQGELRSPTSGSADAHANWFDQWSTGRILVQPSAGLNFSTSDWVLLDGAVTVEQLGTLSVSLPLYDCLDITGEIVLFDNARLNITGGLAMDGALTGVDAVVNVGGQIDTHGSWILNGGDLSPSEPGAHAPIQPAVLIPGPPKHR